jgi:hypothetical protein
MSTRIIQVRAVSDPQKNAAGKFSKLMAFARFTARLVNT